MQRASLRVSWNRRAWQSQLQPCSLLAAGTTSFSRSSQWSCSSLLAKRLQFGEDDRQIFCDRWMNVHGALNDPVRRLGIHDVQQNVNYFVASDAKNCSTQNLFRFCIDADFDETLCLTFFVSPAHLTHRIFCSQGAASGFSYLCVRHAASPEWRINK